jgi:hypothetical protein
MVHGFLGLRAGQTILLSPRNFTYLTKKKFYILSNNIFFFIYKKKKKSFISKKLLELNQDPKYKFSFELKMSMRIVSKKKVPFLIF